MLVSIRSLFSHKVEVNFMCVVRALNTGLVDKYAAPTLSHQIIAEF